MVATILDVRFETYTPMALYKILLHSPFNKLQPYTYIHKYLINSVLRRMIHCFKSREIDSLIADNLVTAKQQTV